MQIVIHFHTLRGAHDTARRACAASLALTFQERVRGKIEIDNEHEVLTVSPDSFTEAKRVLGLLAGHSTLPNT